MSDLSEWRMAWLLVLFDLPTTTKQAKRAYVEFHRFLLDDGFSMMQYSVYGRHAPNREHAETHVARVRRALPERGEVRVIRLTDAQFGRMEVFRGRKPSQAEGAPEQLLIF